MGSTTDLKIIILCGNTLQCFNTNTISKSVRFSKDNNVNASISQKHRPTGGRKNYSCIWANRAFFTFSVVVFLPIGLTDPSKDSFFVATH